MLTPAQGRSAVKKKVLVVEDERILCKTICEILERHNYAVTSVENGFLAKQSLRFNKVDAVICDLKMPGSMVDGLALLQHVKSYHGIPFLLITGAEPSAESLKDLTYVPDAVLLKPFKLEDLTTALRVCLNSLYNGRYAG
jgi:CheY-like chemotaxis protein